MTESTALSTIGAQHVDPPFHAALARATNSLSLASALLAFGDWSLHLAVSPGQRADLARLAFEQASRLAHVAWQSLQPGHVVTGHTELAPPDRRFSSPQWQRWPFNVYEQAFLMTEQWWAAATRDVWGTEPHHLQQVAFAVRQCLDMVSPGNQWATNPVVIQSTIDEGGMNLWRGFQYWLDDLQRIADDAPPAGAESFVVGRDLAVTPGRVVLRNRLMELIQYTPTTAKVHPEPVLLVPAWIMKYYILDLAPKASLIEHLVAQGHTVFCISWKNPPASDRDLGMDDYRELGVMAALDAVRRVVGKRKVHAAGYCLGGTLLSLTVAAMARDGDDRLASMTLFAAQTDFTEPGELALFVDKSQVALLEAQMDATGYLTARQMAGTFQMLRSYDLLWSRLVHDYLLGRRAPMNQLMAWNADGTRLPARMHSQYLNRMFLHNDLAEGRYPVGDKPVSLDDIRLPVFLVGTTTDHVSPWHSVYKLHHLSPAEITFVLASGGHNAGIVSPPGHPNRSFRQLTRPASGSTPTPDDWLVLAPETEGSWWPAWQAWLAAHSSAKVAPPRAGPSLGDAPGEYVRVK